MSLDSYREKIDYIDDQILDLLIKRFDIVQEVKAYKKTNHIDVLDSNREQAIINKIKNRESVYEDELIEIVTCMMNESKKNQRKDD